VILAWSLVLEFEMFHVAVVEIHSEKREKEKCV